MYYRGRKVRTGPRGGLYIILNGQKVSVPKTAVIKIDKNGNQILINIPKGTKFGKDCFGG